MDRPRYCAVLGNQAAPAALKRGRTGWRDDLLAYDRLPEDLRAMLQVAPFEMDAMGVLLAHQANLRRYGSPALALAATAGEFSRFIRCALDAARHESRTRSLSGPPDAWPRC